MNITGRRSVKRLGPIRINRVGLLHVTSVTMALPFRQTWTIWKAARR